MPYQPVATVDTMRSFGGSFTTTSELMIDSCAIESMNSSFEDEGLRNARRRSAELIEARRRRLSRSDRDSKRSNKNNNNKNNKNNKNNNNCCGDDECCDVRIQVTVPSSSEVWLLQL